MSHAASSPALLRAGAAELSSTRSAAHAGSTVAKAPPGDDRDRVIELIGEHGVAVADRTCRPGHLTGSGLVVSHDGRSTLLLFHTKLQKWLQPGGHADGDTNLAAVALREAIEETGIDELLVWPAPIDVDIHEVRPPAEDPHLHLDVRFLVIAPEGVTPVRNHESQALRWVEWNNLERLGVDVGFRRLVVRGRELASVILAEHRSEESSG